MYVSALCLPSTKGFRVENSSIAFGYMLPSQKNICLTLIHYLNLDYTKPNCHMESPVESLMEKLGGKLVSYY